LNNTDVKLVDFGLSGITNKEGVLHSGCGTRGYAAPELLQQKPYSSKVDIWSVGVITYIILAGYVPFYDDNEKLLMDKILQCKFEFHENEWKNQSEESKHFISYLLNTNPDKRPTAELALEHKWLQYE
jgi:serine/threonine protein kinase